MKKKLSDIKELWQEIVWIYRYGKNYTGAILLYVLLGLLATAVGLFSSVVSKYLIDAVTSGDVSRISLIIALYVGFGVTRILLGALTKRFRAHTGVRATNEIREDLFGRFLAIDWQASLDYHSGDLLSRINSDVATVADSILGLIPSLITAGLQFAGALLVILIYDPMMALWALISAPVTVLFSRLFLTKMRALGQKVRERQADLTGFYEEALQNLQAIKAFHLNGTMEERLAGLQQLYKDVYLESADFSVWMGVVMSVLGFATSGLCFAWGAFRLWTGYISFGTMVLFIQMAGTVTSAFSSLVSIVPGAVSAAVSAGRLMKILELPAENSETDEETEAFIEKAFTAGAGLVLENVSFAYREGIPVLEQLNLTAENGQIIGIIAESGGGKTTLIRLLLGLVSPDGGEAFVLLSDGTRKPLSPALRPLFSYVAQEKVVFSGTVAESLRLGNPAAGDEALWDALERACAADFVRALPEGIDTKLGERGAGLSEGQIQRLAIARAILSPAPLLLLDEATSALDFETEKKVIHGLLAGEERRRTVIATTHRPTVLEYCDAVIQL